MIDKIEKQRKIFKILFGIYLFAITWIIVFKMEFGLPNMGNIRNINLIPFGDSVYTNGTLDFSELYMNALAFVPFGIFTGILLSKSSFIKKCIPFIITSIVFETLQFVLAVGRSDITDVINNSLGGLIGLFLYLLLYKLIKDEYKTNRLVLALAIIGTIGMSLLIAILIIVNM